MRTDIVTKSHPTPPTLLQSQSGRDLGSLIRNSVGDALQSISAEVSKELAQATQEQASLQRQLNAATSSSQRAKLTQQLAEATVRVDKLQSAVDKLNSKVGDLSNGSPGGVGAGTFPGSVPPYFPPQEQVPTQMIISVISIIFIGFPLAIAFARLLWKRSNSMPTAVSTNQLPADSARRFDELSHSVDAIAIEVERISENQRYLTKLLSEPRQNAAVGAGRGGAPPAS